jgi:hypothetical protein
MKTPVQQREYARGEAFARNLHMSDVGTLQDAFVLGDFDWRDWFEDKPSRSFIAGLADERSYREQVDSY